MKWIPFPLHPETPQEGQLLEDLFSGRQFDLEAMNRRMQGLMEAQGLPYSPRTHTYNSRLAQELGKWADSQNNEALHDALFRAYFADARNIAQIEVLLDAVSRVGLDPGQARTVLETRSFKDAVDADWEKSRSWGVTGVPTFISGDSRLVGAQDSATLEQFLNAAGAST